jgi:hypothetical protein
VRACSCRVSPGGCTDKGPTRQDRIYDSSQQTVRVARWPVAFGDGGLGEKDEFVLFANNNERGGRVEVELRAGIWVGGCKREMRAYFGCWGGSSLSIASNSPSETPSALDRFSSQKPGRLQRQVTHCDRTRCAWGVSSLYRPNRC